MRWWKICTSWQRLCVVVHLHVPVIQLTDNDEHAEILDGYRGKKGKLVKKIVRKHLQQTLETIQDCVNEKTLDRAYR